MSVMDSEISAIYSALFERLLKFSHTEYNGEAMITYSSESFRFTYSSQAARISVSDGKIKVAASNVDYERVVDMEDPKCFSPDGNDLEYAVAVALTKDAAKKRDDEFAKMANSALWTGTSS
jgi:hypothetical protein